MSISCHFYCIKKSNIFITDILLYNLTNLGTETCQILDRIRSFNRVQIIITIN